MNFCTNYLQDYEAKPCAVCAKKVEQSDKMVADRKTRACNFIKSSIVCLLVHKQCFKCGLCGSPLALGSCALELTSYGPYWFCSHCALRPIAEKEAKLKSIKKSGAIADLLKIILFFQSNETAEN